MLNIRAVGCFERGRQRTGSGFVSMRWQHLIRTASGALAVGCAAAAHADDTTISTAITTPVTTAAAANNAPGNVTIAAGGSVTVTTGAAVTINSANTVTNSGSITNSGTTGAIGVLITTPGPFAFTTNAPLTLTGTGGTGAVGLLIGGSNTGTIAFGTAGSLTVAGDHAYGVQLKGPFTGNIDLRSITVGGATSTAIAIQGQVNGNLSFAGTTTASTTGSTGVEISAPVIGTVRNAGSVSVGTARGVSPTTGLIVAGNNGIAGVRISSNVFNGFLNDRYYIDTTGAVVTGTVDPTVDTLVTGTIVATGSAPALWVAPDSTNQSVTIGAYASGVDGYAVVNRGILETTVSDVGLPAVAMRVGGGVGLTRLTGGIVNQSTGSIIANSLDAKAIGVDLLTGAVVPQLLNQGAITAVTTAVAASGTTAQGPGGAAVAIIVEPGASLTSFVNTGNIAANAVGTKSNATGLLDLSGSNTLASVTNSGMISATVTALTGGTARAIDLSGGTGAVTLTNSGTITGDVVLGNGATSVALTSGMVNGTATNGTINGALVFGTSTANSLTLSGASSFTGTLATPAPIAVSLADTSRLSLVSGPATLASIAASGASMLVVPVVSGNAAALTVNGAASFTGTSTIALSLQSLAPSQNVTILSAGSFATDHLATLVGSSISPYLFTASPAVATATTLSIGLTRKTAAQVGLTGGQANLFDASIAALNNSSTASAAAAAAIANLPSQAAVAAAYRQITPPSFGRGQLRVAQSVSDTGFGAAADRLAILIDRGRPLRSDDNYGLGLWAQEYGDFNRQAAGLNEPTFTTSTFGVAGGIDTTRFAHAVVGIGFVADFATIHHDPAGTESGFNVPATTSGVEPYIAFNFKPLFIEATGLVAHVGYSANRTLTIGNITDTVVSNWGATQYAAAVNVGARFKLGKYIRVTPSNALSWTSLHQEAYTEQGAGAFSLAVAKQTDSVTSDTAKLALAILHPLGDGLLKFEIHGAYTHQFNVTPTGTVANFVSGSSVISLPGDVPRSDERSYGADLGYSQDTIAFRGGYDRREATGYRDQSLAVSATIGF